MKKIKNNFFENGLDCLKVQRGVESDYYYILRVSCRSDSHLTFAKLLKIGNQLFAVYLPELDKDWFLQMRQDIKDGNLIDLEFKVPGHKGHIKPLEIHHQPSNDKDFYYREISYGKWTIRIVIAKNSSYEELFRIYEKIMNEK